MPDFTTPPVVEVTDAGKPQAPVDCLKAMIESGHPQSSELRIALFALCSYVKVVGWLSQRGIGINDASAIYWELAHREAPPPPPPPKGGPGKKRKTAGGIIMGEGERVILQIRIIDFLLHPGIRERWSPLLRTASPEEDSTYTLRAVASF